MSRLYLGVIGCLGPSRFPPPDGLKTLLKSSTSTMQACVPLPLGLYIRSRPAFALNPSSSCTEPIILLY